jgi:hypothetical protein
MPEKLAASIVGAGLPAKLLIINTAFASKPASTEKIWIFRNSDNYFSLCVLYVSVVDTKLTSRISGMNMTINGKTAVLIVLLGMALAPGLTARADESTEALARAAQNPVANLISVPFQDNINFNYGPEEKTQNVLNIQPVIPVSLGRDWNLITRTILPVISQPEFFPGEGRTDGLGDTQFTAFLSPARTEGLIWGAGPILQLPSHNDKVLGNDRWGIGPSAVVLRIQGHWVYGALANNL